MSENLQVVLIAGSVSLVVSLIGVLSTLFVQKIQSRNTEKQIRTNVADKLLSLRLEHYPTTFTITEKIQRKKEPQRIITRQGLQEINNELIAWKTGIVSLILSKEAIDAFYDLRDTLNMGYAEKENFSREQVEKIMSARDKFRGVLRYDIGFLHVRSPRLEKQK